MQKALDARRYGVSGLIVVEARRLITEFECLASNAPSPPKM